MVFTYSLTSRYYYLSHRKLRHKWFIQTIQFNVHAFLCSFLCVLKCSRPLALWELLVGMAFVPILLESSTALLTVIEFWVN